MECKDALHKVRHTFLYLRVKQMKKINVGIIGCGRISDLHYLGYRNNKKARIYAVCDCDKDIALERKKEWKAVKYYTDYQYLLKDPEIDAVEILTPHTAHEEMVVNAAQMGKHIAVQKPMTISLESADRMLEAVLKKDIVYKVTDNYLFYPPIALAKKMIEDGTIGTPSNMRIKLIACPSGGWEVPMSTWEWRMQEAAAGRGIQTFDHGHHLWATAWYLLGDVERVVSWIDSVDGIVDSPATIMWKYREPITYGMCEYIWAPDMCIPSKYYSNDEWIEISGTKGIILINQCTGNILSGPAVSLFTGKKWKHFSKLKCDWAEGFKGATQNFINAIRGDDKPLLTGEEGREILRFNLAIQKSSRVHREVYLDELDSLFPSLYRWRRSRSERGSILPIQKFKEVIGRSRGHARYASRARSLTLELMDKFDPDAVQNWESTIGLDLLPENDTPELKFSILITKGSATVEEGSLPEKGSLILRIPSGTWAAILLGKEKIEQAFTEGKIVMDGEIDEALKVRAAFGL
jgi:predicted dehydrogenase